MNFLLIRVGSVPAKSNGYLTSGRHGEMTIVILGSRGLVGSAVCRYLTEKKLDFIAATRQEIDVTNSSSIDSFFGHVKPSVVIAAAAKVGGLMANYEYPVEFLSENVLSQTYLMDASYKHDVEKFVFLGSSCIYPKDATQPISEASLLTGPLEVTNEAYAIAKIAGVKLVQGYRREYGRRWISVMPTNLYGINDNFDLKTSHALPALMRKFHDAKIEGQDKVELWGTGKPRREFMFSDDFASALMHVVDNYDDDNPVNIGTGIDVSILELSEIMRGVVGFEGSIQWNTSIPDGTFRKLLDISKLNSLGWKSQNDLASGLRKTYEWFTANYDTARLNVEISPQI
jgi:GDP-L-fucose synthase